ncbi:BPSS1780 family membrane protein [Methylophilaceae bacterium]|nr:BPSS1780 family membrane protein [Methylophilaceae bacterium]
MKNFLIQSWKWILLSINLFKVSVRSSLFIGMSYLFIYLIIPIMPSTQFLGPVTIIAWPFVTVYILYFYFCVYSKKKFEATEAFKIFSMNPRGLFFISVLSAFYVTIIGLLVSSDIESITNTLQIEQESELNSFDFGVLLLKLLIMGVPFYMATWFSPLLIASHNYGLLKAIKSSFAGTLMYIFPLFFAWLVITFGFIGLVIIITFLFNSMSFLSLTLSSLLTSIFLLFLMASFVAIMFSFQFITFIDIYKKFTN